MKGSQEQIKKAADIAGAAAGQAGFDQLKNVVNDAGKKGDTILNAGGMSPQMVEGIYGQAFRLYNTGKYRDAGQLFRLLIMLNSSEPKYTMGLAACFHMLKEYKSAVEMYMVCSVLDPENPIPHYHASDCYIQMKSLMSALISLEMAVKRANKPEYQTLKDRALLTIESLKKELASK